MYMRGRQKPSQVSLIWWQTISSFCTYFKAVFKSICTYEEILHVYFKETFRITQFDSKEVGRNLSTQRVVGLSINLKKQTHPFLPLILNCRRILFYMGLSIKHTLCLKQATENQTKSN